MTPGVVVWLTGLPAAGKSTLAERVHARLVEDGRPSAILDSDVVRALTHNRGYSPEAREQSYALLASLAATLAKQGLAVLVPATAHLRVYREAARSLAPRFIEVYVRVPAEECARRDPKGLYAMAQLGHLRNLPGVGVEYEPPEHADVIADGGFDQEAVDATLRAIVLASPKDEEENTMSTTSRRFRMIVAVDSSPYAHVVLEQALDQAARHEAPDIHIVQVIDDRPRLAGPNGEEDARVLRALHEMVTGKLEDFGRGPATLGTWRVFLHLRHGRPAEEIADLAGQAEADLVVVGRFGSRGVRRLLVGSTADRVLKLVPGPVLVVQLTGHEPSHAEAQCPGCVAERAASSGETWFCIAHRGGHLGTSTLLTTHEGFGIGPNW